jgi:hypothetical protein
MTQTLILADCLLNVLLAVILIREIRCIRAPRRRSPHSKDSARAEGTRTGQSETPASGDRAAPGVDDVLPDPPF